MHAMHAQSATRELSLGGQTYTEAHGSDDTWRGSDSHGQALMRKGLGQKGLQPEEAADVRPRF